ncbi:PREDICTED: 39S ribosomal protein L30, mitochondrial [Nanorana parkeri]|uniref:39S ribosomal protein L30, mitochondrial n=1 Tax=Nanorana parkeri TaxID=125878 RepID=UPI000854BBFE|nr:PREDICTED: 39S ribosomal protein L30, mitochondrial [Nanorana parkeri]
MALGFCKAVQTRTIGLKLFTDHPVLSLVWPGSVRHKFTRSRIPEETFQPKPEDHEKYGGDPQQPHKLHLITRVRSVIGRPYWEKDVVRRLGLEKAYKPVIHKNIPAVNEQLKMIKHLVRYEGSLFSYGLPAEEEMSSTYLNSKGELVICKRLQPVETKYVES